MKRILSFIAIVLVSVLAMAQNDTPKTRINEIVESEIDEQTYSVFQYFNEDGTVGIYLGLDVPEVLLPGNIISVQAPMLTELCLYLGKDMDDALEGFDRLIALFSEAPRSVWEFPARVLALNVTVEDCNVECIVRRRLIGKRLEIRYDMDGVNTVNYLTKGVVKGLRTSFRINAKRLLK